MAVTTTETAAILALADSSSFFASINQTVQHPRTLQANPTPAATRRSPPFPPPSSLSLTSQRLCQSWPDSFTFNNEEKTEIKTKDASSSKSKTPGSAGAQQRSPNPPALAPRACTLWGFSAQQSRINLVGTEPATTLCHHVPTFSAPGLCSLVPGSSRCKRCHGDAGLTGPRELRAASLLIYPHSN